MHRLQCVGVDVGRHHEGARVAVPQLVRAGLGAQRVLAGRIRGGRAPREGAELLEQNRVRTQDELPHSIATRVTEWEWPRIRCEILVERDSQKGIVIGKKGAMLKKIGQAARGDIERLLGTRVYLELFVKVQPGWRDSKGFLDSLDWRRQLENLSTREPQD